MDMRRRTGFRAPSDAEPDVLSRQMIPMELLEAHEPQTPAEIEEIRRWWSSVRLESAAESDLSLEFAAPASQRLWPVLRLAALGAALLALGLGIISVTPSWHGVALALTLSLVVGVWSGVSSEDPGSDEGRLTRKAAARLDALALIVGRASRSSD